MVTKDEHIKIFFDEKDMQKKLKSSKFLVLIYAKTKKGGIEACVRARTRIKDEPSPDFE